MKHIFKLFSSFWYQILFIVIDFYELHVYFIYWLLEIEFENVFSQFISWLFICWFLELLLNSFYFRLSGWIFLFVLPILWVLHIKTSLIRNYFKFKIIFIMCMYVFISMICSACGIQRRTWFSPLPCRNQGSNSGHQTWQQVPLLIEQFSKFFFTFFSMIFIVSDLMFKPSAF